MPFSDVFLVSVKPCSTATRLWKGATVHDQTCPCMHGFRWRTFGTFVMNFDLNYKKLRVIKLGTFLLICYVIFE